MNGHVPPDSCETSPVPLTSAGLYRLFALLSPAFPVGAFTYSHGLERVIEDGDIRDAASLEAYLASLLRFGSGQADAVLLSVAHGAARHGNPDGVREAAELGLALAPSKERHLETSAQGTAFLDTCRKAWAPATDTPAGQVFAALVPQGGLLPPWPYPVAVGLTAAAWEIPCGPTLGAYLQAFSASLISAAIRAVPLGQTDGQRVLHRLESVILEVCHKADKAHLSDIGSAGLATDISSMLHETQYTRLFRS